MYQSGSGSWVGHQLQYRGMLGWLTVKEIAFDDTAARLILRTMFQQQGMQARQAIVRDQGEEMVRQVIIHAQGKDGPADQAAHQEDTGIEPAIAAAVAVLHHLSGDHAESEAR